MTYTILFWILAAATTFLRLLVIGRIGLGDDEAHYWAYSQYPDLSYFDHPPAIGYIIRFFTSVFGANEFAVRLPAVLFFLCLAVLIFFLAKKMYGDKVAFWSAVLLQITPVFSFLGAVLTVPDAPLALCWALFMYLFWQIINGKGAWLWYAAGVTLGIGMLGKYNAVLLPASAFLFLVFSPKHRYWLLKKEPYLALALSSVIFLPVILWNMENSWASFGFQLAHGFGKEAPAKLSFDQLGRALGAQAGYISPFLFLIDIAVLGWLAWQVFKHRDEKALYLFSFSFPTLFLFNGVASFHEILPHWPATGYLSLVIAVAYLTVTLWDRAWVKAATFTAWGLGLFLTVLVPLQAVYKVLPPELFLPAQEAAKIEDGITKAEKVDVTNELYGWPEAGKAVAELIASYPEGKKPFIFTHRHYIASQLSFYVPGHPRIYCLSDRIDAYDFWQRDIGDLQGRDAVFVADNRFYSDPRGVYPFASWQEPKVIEVFRAGRKIRLFWLYAAKDFNAGALQSEYTANLVGPRAHWKDTLRRYDHAYFCLINRDRHCVALDYAMRALSAIGNGLPLTVVVGIVLWFTRRETFWRDFLFAFAIVLLGGLLVQAIKEIVGRVRPPTVFGDGARVLGDRLFRSSFPSGHSQSAFAAATFLTMKLKKYGWLFFMIAFLVAVSRIYVGAHFPIDTVVGSFIGVVTAYLAVKYIKN